MRKSVDYSTTLAEILKGLTWSVVATSGWRAHIEMMYLGCDQLMERF